jgi:molybdopterin-binding protein
LQTAKDNEKAPNAKGDNGTSTWKKYDGQIVTVFALAATVIIAVLGFNAQNVLVTSIAVAALGGIVHEIAQTNGTFMLPGRDAENPRNVYLGGLYGLIAGGVAGLILVQTPNQGLTTALLSEAFLAGLALKSVSEAVADQTAGPAQQKQAS